MLGGVCMWKESCSAVCLSSGEKLKERNRCSTQTALKLAWLHEQPASWAEKVQNANNLLNKICQSLPFGHCLHGSMGCCGLMQLSKLASSDGANDFLACLPREWEGKSSPHRLMGQQCLSWKQLEFIEVKVCQREEAGEDKMSQKSHQRHRWLTLCLFKKTWGNGRKRWKGEILASLQRTELEKESRVTQERMDVCFGQSEKEGKREHL